MSNCVSFEVQVASILELLAKAAVAEITKLFDGKSAALRSEICTGQTENEALKWKLLQMESELRAVRGGCAEGTPDDSINISFEVQVCDKFREAQRQCINRLPTEGVARGQFESCGSVSMESDYVCLQTNPVKREPVDGKQDWPESPLLSKDRLEEDSEGSQSRAEQCFNAESNCGTFGAAVAAADSVARPLCEEVKEPHMQPCSSGDSEKRLQVEPKQEVLPLASPPPMMRVQSVWSEASSVGEILQNHGGMDQQSEVQPVDGKQDWPESPLLSKDRLEEDSKGSQPRAEQCFNAESNCGTFGEAVASADSVTGPLCEEAEELHMQPCSSGDPEKRLQVEPKQDSEVLPLAPPPPMMRVQSVSSEASSVGELLQNHGGMDQQSEVQTVDGEQDWPESPLLSEDGLEEDSEGSQSQAEQCSNAESNCGTFGAAVASVDSVTGPLCEEAEELHMQPCSSGHSEKQLQMEPKQDSEVLPLASPPPMMRAQSVSSKASSVGELLQNHGGMDQQSEVQNESETGEDGESDDDRNPEHVPSSKTDTEEEEPINNLENSKSLVAKESLLVNSMDLDKIGDTSGINRKSANKKSRDAITDALHSTTVDGGGKNFCFFCKKANFKISRHFRTHVKEDADIAKALSLPAGSKSRKELLEKLRNRGNFIHNNEVLKKGCGSLKVKRRANGEHTKYEYCIHCRGMFMRTELWRHMKRCSPQPEDQEPHGRKRVLSLASVAKSAFSSPVEDGVLKMLSQMHEDIASVVRNDFCLLRFAESLYNVHGHDASKRDYICQKIRLLGRFLQTMRKKSPFLNLEDAIKPGNFMKVIEAVKETAGFNKDQNSYKFPSRALKIGCSLLKVSDIIHCHAVMAGDEDLIKSSEAFLKLYRTKWSEYISPSAKLPLTEDIAKLHEHLEQKSESAAAALKEETTVQNYSLLARTTLTKIVLFNRRCVGEVSKMKLRNFLERDCSNTHEEVGLSEDEQKLCSYFVRVELKGKRGRKVAVLLTPEMTNALNLMIEKRKECGVPDENEYLFAVPSCLTYYRGHQILRRIADECGAKKPDYLRSTQLRKEIATTSQILNLKNNVMDQLSDFLEHDISVHGQFYRLSELTAQSAKIAKLLLALEKGRLRELQGKSLDEIGDFTESDDEDESEDEETIAADTALEADAPDENNDEKMDTSEGASSTKADRHNSGHKVARRRKRRSAKPWTKVEVNAVMRHFKSHVMNGHLATKRECEVCKNSERQILQNRTLQNIRDYVRNKGLAFKRYLVKNPIQKTKGLH